MKSIDFDNEASWKAAAKRAFGDWARENGAPDNVEEFIVALRRADECFAILKTEYSQRDVVWKCEPVPASTPTTEPPLSPDEVDPWRVDQDTLREESVHAHVCSDCLARGECEAFTETGKVRRWLQVSTKRGREIRTSEGVLPPSRWPHEEDLKQRFLARFAARDASDKAPATISGKKPIPTPELPDGARISTLQLMQRRVPIIWVEYAVKDEHALIPLIGEELEVPQDARELLFQKKGRRSKRRGLLFWL